MATGSVPSDDQLEPELKSILSELRSIRVEFVGPAPGPIHSTEEWDEAIHLRLIIQSSDTRDFATAWHEAVSRARNTIYCRLVPWAHRAVELFGAGAFPSDIPDPPQNVVPPAMGLEGGILTAIAGTSDTVSAGQRIIYWAAAQLSPTALRRCEDHRWLFWQWTGRILDWRGDAIIASVPILDAVCAAYDVLSRDRPEPPPTDQLAVDATPNQYIIRTQHSGAFLVEFGREIGEIRGEGALRFVQLCREQQVAVDVLAGEVTGIAVSDSIVERYEMPTAQGAERISEAAQLGGQEVRRLRQQLRKTLEDLQLRINSCSSDEERERLEAKQLLVVRQQNSLQRIPASDVQKMRDRIEQSLRRMAQSKNQDMPRFSDHVLACWEFDELRLRYEYTDANEIDWDFVSF